MRIRKPKKQYIPDVMYKETDQYKNEIVKHADPNFPAEFFLIPVCVCVSVCLSVYVCVCV